MSAHTPTLVMGHIVCLGPGDEEGIPYDEAVVHLEGDEDSEIEVHCPGAFSLAEKIVRAVNRDHHFDALVKALEKIEQCSDCHFAVDAAREALAGLNGDVGSPLTPAAHEEGGR